MTTVILCSWSSILILTYLVYSKYRWTAPPWRVLLLFAAAGVIAGNFAGFINMFIGRETELWFFSQDRFSSIGGFFLGAGLGEEFWKFGWGMAILLTLVAVGRAPREPGIVLAFVVLGLSFATFENLVSYSGIGILLLLTRGVSAVPLHGAMGMIHGVGAAAAVRRHSFWPVLLAYVVSALAHTLYDVMPRLLPDLPQGTNHLVLFANFTMADLWQVIANLSIFPLVTLLLIWCYIAWHRVPEIAPADHHFST